MKHILPIFTALLLFLSLTAYADVETPDFFSENFSSMTGGQLDQGWTAQGIDASPIGAVSSFFSDTDGAFKVLKLADMNIAMANTEFGEGIEADQWLISPEITVPYDNAGLLFTACAFTNLGQDMGVGMNNFKVLLSEGGTEKEDFSQTLIESGIRGSATVEVTTKRMVASINGKKNRKIRIAFVVTGSNVGFTGFTDLRMGQYILSVENLTREVAPKGSKISIDVNIGLKTPVECGYLDATLNINGTPSGEQEYKKTFGSPTSFILQMQRIKFDDVFTLESHDPVEYTLTLLPRFEGALPAVITGLVSTPGATYPNNVVVEELTATGCGWCPRGTAYLNYYSTIYPGSETIGRAIPIALHGFMSYTDPMNEGVENYFDAVEKLNESLGLPAATFNRSTRGLDPSYAPALVREIEKRSYNKTDIKSVTANNSSDGKTSISVDFELRNGYNTSKRELNASVVLLENNVHGVETGYIQTNNLAVFNAQSIADAYGQALVPFFEPFIMDGELGYSMIPAAKMYYQHVARGVFPDFTGISTDHEWISDVPKSFNITFDLPSNVQDLNNTEIVVLITDPKDNSIVASDTLEAADYTSTAIKEISENDSVRVEKSEDGLMIFSSEQLSVNIYSIDGKLFYCGNKPSGISLNIPIVHNGMLIVEMQDSKGQNFVKKIIR